MRAESGRHARADAGDGAGDGGAWRDRCDVVSGAAAAAPPLAVPALHPLLVAGVCEQPIPGGDRRKGDADDCGTECGGYRETGGAGGLHDGDPRTDAAVGMLVPYGSQHVS